MKNNTVKLFLKLNQGASRYSRNFCTVYASFINARFNKKGFPKVEEKEVLDYSTKLIEKGLLSESKGGYLKPTFEQFTKDYKLDSEIFNKNDKKLDELLSKGYMIRIGINVSKGWLRDAEDDGIINMYKDYENYKEGKQYGHCCNIILWNTGSDAGKYFIYDSYFGKHSANLYEIPDFKEFREDVMFNNCYCVI